MQNRALLFACGAAALTFATGAAGANPSASSSTSQSRLAPAFGNTVVTTYPDGRQQSIWLRADGRWDGLSRKNTPLAGTWKVDGDKLCMKQSKPPTLPVAYCTSFPSGVSPGVVWTSKDMGGTPIKLKLVRGLTQATAKTDPATP